MFDMSRNVTYRGVVKEYRNGSKDVLLFYAVKADGTRLYRAQHRYPSEAE